MDLGIKDKVALVLASSKGLGKSVALGLAREGARVIICGRDRNVLGETENEIKNSTGAKVFSIPCDLTQEDQRRNLTKFSKDKWGSVDILVTNTGGPPPGSFEEFELDDWDGLFNHLFLSAVDVIKKVLPDMKENNYGRILTITSISVKQPVDNLISSNAVRSAILGFMKSLSNEVATYGITVNNIMPGFTLTERLKKLMDENPKFGEVEDLIPMKRLGTPEEFASAAVFLVSESASYITGVSLPVDGGWIKGF